MSAKIFTTQSAVFTRKPQRTTAVAFLVPLAYAAQKEHGVRSVLLRERTIFAGDVNRVEGIGLAFNVASDSFQMRFVPNERQGTFTPSVIDLTILSNIAGGL